MEQTLKRYLYIRRKPAARLPLALYIINVWVSLPVSTYGSAALAACEVVKQATKFLADEFTEFFL